MKSLRESICHYITVQENVQCHVSNDNLKVKGQPFVSKQTRPLTASHRPSTEVLAVNSQAGSSVGGQARASLPCIFCKDNHFNDMCDKCVTLTERKQKLSQQKRCFICLKIGHMSRNCPSSQKKSCCYCGKKGYHNRCLCPHKFTRQETDALIVTEVNESSKDSIGGVSSVDQSNQLAATVDSNVTPMLLASGERVLLQIATVPVQSVNGSVTVTARVLLDSASQRTFMTDQLAKRLELTPDHRELLSVSTFGAGKATDVDTYVVHFTVKLKDGSHMLMFANVLKQITGNIQRGPLQQKDIEFLQLIPKDKLADLVPHSREVTTIDLLIGSDYFWDVVGGDKIMLPSGMFMLPSKFGYIITGRCPEANHNGRDRSPCTLFVAAELDQLRSNHTLDCSVNVSLVKNPNLENFWCLETIGIKDSMCRESDDEALEKFCETIKYQDRRYQVTWPWKSDTVCLTDNYEVAIRRMKSLARRLQLDVRLLQIYDDVIKQQLNKGIIERVDDTALVHTKRYYLPHHPVLTPNKATTKVRIVYDASSKARDNMNSLNECLHRGPVILPDLCGLLIRFRVYPIVILADIEKAFLQVGIQSTERDVTRFLWFKDPAKPDIEDNLITYRFCRVPFGLVCSPFLLGATIKFHLQKEGTPLALHILKNIYVDNVLIGVDSISDTCGIYKEAKSIFERSAMNLREWNSNCLEFLQSLPTGERSAMSDATNVLGLLWNQFEDTINIPGFDKAAISEVVTKRDVLHSVAKIFDPLGLLSPIIFHGKMFLQKLWVVNKPWDEPLCTELLEEWNQVVKLLAELSNLNISRFVGNTNNGDNQLLIFCDASMKAYATVLYLRIKEGTKFQTNLLFSKMRLVRTARGKKGKYVKHLTIPRLELLAMLIGVRAANFIVKELGIEISERILWSDSQCVLHWLRTKKPLSVFVENRIKEILKEKDITFQYIASNQNPADIATRGSSVFELSQSTLWWHGPSWLQEDDSSWPVWNFSDITPKVQNQLQSEEKGFKSVIETTTVIGISNKQDQIKTASLFGIDEKRFSSLRQLLRVSVYVLKFIKKKVWNLINVKKRKHFQHKLLSTIFEELTETIPIVSREIKLSSLLWVSFIQH